MEWLPPMGTVSTKKDAPPKMNGFYYIARLPLKRTVSTQKNNSK